MKTTDFKELTKIYLDVSQDYVDYEDVAEERKKAMAELTRIVPDTELQDDITDCFGMSIELNQRQGFIQGFQYAMKLFLEAQGVVKSGVCGNE